MERLLDALLLISGLHGGREPDQGRELGETVRGYIFARLRLLNLLLSLTCMEPHRPVNVSWKLFYVQHLL